MRRVETCIPISFGHRVRMKARYQAVSCGGCALNPRSNFLSFRALSPTWALAVLFCAGTSLTAGAFDQADCSALRLAIQDLSATFGEKYPKGEEYLRRLTAYEQCLPDLQKRFEQNAPSAAREWADILAFQREALLANPLLDFDRLLYLRWEYTDIPHVWARRLFTMNPDGTGQREFYGSGDFWPNAIFYARPIPDHSTKVVGIVTGHASPWSASHSARPSLSAAGYRRRSMPRSACPPKRNGNMPAAPEQAGRCPTAI